MRDMQRFTLQQVGPAKINSMACIYWQCHTTLTAAHVQACCVVAKSFICCHIQLSSEL